MKMKFFSKVSNSYIFKFSFCCVDRMIFWNFWNSFEGANFQIWVTGVRCDVDSTFLYELFFYEVKNTLCTIGSWICMPWNVWCVHEKLYPRLSSVKKSQAKYGHKPISFLPFMTTWRKDTWREPSVIGNYFKPCHIQYHTVHASHNPLVWLNSANYQWS